MSRGQPIDEHQIGTLHAICYRMLGSPEIAESNVGDFNTEHPHLALSKHGETILDDGISTSENDVSGERGGDDLLSMLNIYRAKRTSKEFWLPAVLDFHYKWSAYKQENGYFDFQDLIETAIERRHPPFNASVGFFDEAQDFTPSQIHLIRTWAKSMESITFLGDDDQLLYSFTGATPEAFLNPPLPDSHKLVLSQSYRVPSKVLTLANKIISKVSVREPKEYLPRDHDGKIYSSSATWKSPASLIPIIKNHIQAGKHIMVLATCSYMLAPLIMELRQAGIPFSNRYKPTRGDWNPIRRKQTGSAGAYGRLVAYMEPAGPEFQGVRLWTPAQLLSWTEHVKVKGNFKTGAKKILKEMCDTKETPAEVILGAMLGAMEEEAFEHAVSFDLNWFLSQITPAKQKGFEFPSRIYTEYGDTGPDLARLCTVGTVHSVKGGEADCTVVFPDLSLRAAQHYVTRHGEQFDQILRQFYVAITRTRDTLILCKGVTRGMVFNDYT